MKKRILFVDDEPNFLDGLRRMLRDQRSIWDLSFASGVDEALEQIRTTEFDTIVTDVRMPGKDGFELLGALEEDSLGLYTPVIVLTGNAEADLKRRALESGATDLLNKPVNREDLIARLNSVLRLKSYQDALRNQNEVLDRKVKERTVQLEQSRVDIIWRLAKASEYRDEDTGNHITRVACYSRLLAESISLSEEQIKTLFLTSPLHDIGKIGIPDGILLKKGKLDPEERTIMEKHCEIGNSILLEEAKGIASFLEFEGFTTSLDDVKKLENPLIAMAASIAMTHHEKWDGSGYPERLLGEEIPIEGRIVSIADVYDALSSKRPYKEAFPEDQVLGLLEEGAGKAFDPYIYDAFVECRNEFREIRIRHSESEHAKLTK